MATGDKNDLLNTISNSINDNNTGDVTPADVRTTESAIVTYNLNQKELTTQTVDGVVSFLSGQESKTVQLTPQLSDPPNSEGLVWYDNANKGIAFYNNLGKQLSRTRLNFLVASSDSISVSNDPNASSFFTGLAGLGDNQGFTVDAATGSVINTSGRNIAKVTGQISIQPTKSGGSVTLLSVFSEKSTDGVSWTKNANSARTYDLSNTGESFKTSASFTLNWSNGEYLRFRMFANDATISLEPPSVVADSVTIEGYSVVWELEEK